jgi:hypothetical protein
MYRIFFLSMAGFWLLFGLGTTFYPQMMQMFMTPEGIASGSAFANQVWLHEGLDILSVSILLYALSTVPATKTTLRLAAVVGLLPTIAVVYTLKATPFWAPIFLVPGAGCAAFTVWGLYLARTAPAR